MNPIKPEQSNPGENAELRENQFPADEGGITTSFAEDGAKVLTPDGPKSEHVVPQDEFWNGVQNADQTPREVQSAVSSGVPDPNQMPGDISQRSDATGDTDSSVLI